MRVIGRRYLGKNAAVLKRVIAITTAVWTGVPTHKTRQEHLPILRCPGSDAVSFLIT